jgi:hypothetical protein
MLLKFAYIPFFPIACADIWKTVYYAHLMCCFSSGHSLYMLACNTFLSTPSPIFPPYPLAHRAEPFSINPDLMPIL